ncbi:mannose-6-phosphate isomerase, class I [Dermabacter sp. Marseille-Q3180]|uniref:mannose-6-phosphate isomerase, class I n=1 Tax=Dermabacter sp. Marseille-Q3180 TaxID=2758090 RepID=UPI002023BF20|nr:mannose-6-phosphate isomerase, class I [Dermabacter sp. Marseille-Q3180]
MRRLSGHLQRYAWGSPAHLPEFLSVEADGTPWAELWFGAHPLAPATLTASGEALNEAIAHHPESMLGESVTRAFGNALPFLLKLIAPKEPLSLQVHPTREHARECFAAENAAGLALDSPERNYRDANHKPEMVLALEPFEALCGFRTPRKAASILEGLEAPLAKRILALLEAQPSAHGMRAAFRMLVAPTMRPDPRGIVALAEECAARLRARTSPSPRIDRAVALLNEKYPGDPGVAATLLLNPVSLKPGEAMFVPAGALHSYLSGFAVEIMASSDNVLRAGITPKKVDADELLQCVSVSAAPPIRIAPERLNDVTSAYFAPIDDFELSTFTSEAGDDSSAQTFVGTGPRIVVCLDGPLTLDTSAGSDTLERGEAVFIAAHEGALTVRGHGRLVQASVP